MNMNQFIASLTFMQFVELFGTMWNKEKGRYEKWELWDGVERDGVKYAGQRDMLMDFEKQEISWLAKARQLAGSEGAATYAVYLAMKYPNSLITVFSKDFPAAEAFLMERVKMKIDGMLKVNDLDGKPWPFADASGVLPWRTKLDGNCVIDGAVRFFNGSSIEAFSSENTGPISRSPRLVILDEARTYARNDAQEMWSGILGALNPPMQVIVISTGKAGTWYNDMTLEIDAGKVEGVRITFLPDDIRPGHDAEWRRRRLSALKGDVARLQREHPLCLTGETRISTERGIVKISEADGCITTESGKISDWFARERSPVFKVKTICGRVIRGTADHPVKLFDGGFCNIGELRGGDVIELRPPMFSEKPYEFVWFDPPAFRHSVAIDEDMALFLGFYMGDGSYHNNTLSIVSDYKDLDSVAVCKGLVERLFAVPQERHIKPRGAGRGKKGPNPAPGYVELRVSCAAAKYPLTQMGAIRRSHGGVRRDVRVPECIFRSPKHVVRQFLRGLFDSDGCAGKQGVSFSSNKLEFIQDIQLLLLGFGVTSRISERKRSDATSKKQYLWYEMKIGRAASRVFMRDIGFVSARKNSVSYEGVSNLKRTGGRAAAPIEFSDVVLSVEPDGTEETFDITVDDSHVFSANGVLVHNCLKHMFSTSEGMVIGSWDKDIHVGSRVMDWKDGDEYYIVYDHGHTMAHPAVAIFVCYNRYEDFAYVFDEVFMRGKEVVEVARAIKVKHEFYVAQGAPRVTAIADTAIFNDLGLASVADMLIAESGIQFGKAFKHKKEHSLDLVQTRFFHQKILIDPVCTGGIKQVSGWVYQEGKDKPVEIEDDFQDCLRYLCAQIEKGERPVEETVLQRSMKYIAQLEGRAARLAEDGSEGEFDLSGVGAGDLDNGLC